MQPHLHSWGRDTGPSLAFGETRSRALPGHDPVANPVPYVHPRVENMKRTGIILAGAAMVTQVILATVGHPGILCIEADGRLAFEDGAAACCQAPVASSPTLARSAAIFSRPAGSAGLPCDDCVDIELPGDMTFQSPQAPLDVKALSMLALLQPARTAAFSPPSAEWCRLLRLVDPGGDRSLESLRTVVLRC